MWLTYCHIHLVGKYYREYVVIHLRFYVMRWKDKAVMSLFYRLFVRSCLEWLGYKYNQNNKTKQTRQKSFNSKSIHVDLSTLTCIWIDFSAQRSLLSSPITVSTATEAFGSMSVVRNVCGRQSLTLSPIAMSLLQLINVHVCRPPSISHKNTCCDYS